MDAIAELRELNFGNLLKLDCEKPSDYGFGACRANGCRHPDIQGFCIECERKGCNKSTAKAGFSLKNMGHGAHSLDFLEATATAVDADDWRDDPVMFVAEAPFRDYGTYGDGICDGYRKRPTRQWSWVHGDLDPARFPKHFRGGEYGRLFMSLMFTFGLRNAYMTNLVKCGMNSDDGQDFQPGLQAFEPECVHTCRERYLRREIEIMRPRLVFAFGAGVYARVKAVVGKELRVCELPHPASGRRGFIPAYFRILYFWVVALELKREGIISSVETEDLAATFARDYEEPYTGRSDYE